MSLSKEVSNGQKTQSSQMGMQMPATDENFISEVVSHHPFGESIYKSSGVKMELKGTDNIDDKPAYVVEITKPDGSVATEYYEVASGLKLRSEESMESPMGAMTVTVDYSNYTNVDGIMMAMTTKQKIGPEMVTINQKNVQINKAIEDATFVIK
jgi:outer membrane lipoprotein-sorting protein